MKQVKYFFAALLCMMTSIACYADDKIIPVDQLPAEAKAFIQQQFPGKIITYAEVDRGFKKTYEARLNDGTKVSFDRKGVWDKVDCHLVAVPADLVPAPIQEYVNTSFPGALIVKIDKERYGYDIELSNDLELKFNPSGNLLRIDD